MSDIRKIVTEDRGLIKKFQAFIPGYKKYRNTEDLRISDSLLRKELARELEKIESILEGAREDATRNMDLDQIKALGDLINYSHKITEKVRHAEQGYSGISTDVKIQENELHALYDYDLGLFHWLNKLQDKATMVQDLFRAQHPQRSLGARDMYDLYREFESTFDLRLSKITNVAQVK
jgi:hypothetical protein